MASPPARAVILTLKALAVPYELIDVNLLASEHKSENYMKVRNCGAKYATPKRFSKITQHSGVWILSAILRVEDIPNGKIII